MAAQQHPLGTSPDNYTLRGLKEAVALSKAAAINYMRTYFAKSTKPAGVYFWKPCERSFTHMSFDEFKTVVPKDCFRHDLEGAKSVKWTPYDWFTGAGNEELFEVDIDPAKARVYERSKALYVNLFPGFLHSELKPYAEYSNEARAAVDLMLEHLRIVWANRDEKVYEYLLSWFARVVTGGRNDSLIYARSEQGTGKSSFTDFLRDRVLGQQLVFMTDCVKPITGEFNGELMGKLLMVLEEPPTETKGQWASLANSLKAKVTSDTIGIRELYKPRVQYKNTVSYVMLTNNASLRIEAGDRRIVMLDINPEMRGNREYFNRLHDSLEVADAGAAFAARMHIIASKPFAARVLPETQAKRDAVVDVLDPIHVYLKEAYLAKGRGLDIAFSSFYDELSRVKSMENKVPSKIVVSKKLQQVEINTSYKKKLPGTKSVVNWLKISFEELRAVFAARHWIHEVDEIPVERGAPAPDLIDQVYDTSALDDLVSTFDVDTRASNAKHETTTVGKLPAAQW